jgi:hypothetical protein
MPPKIVKQVTKRAKTLRKQANNGVLYADVKAVEHISKSASKALAYGGMAASSLGQPELSAPLFALSGSSMLVSKGANDLAKSGLLRKKVKKRGPINNNN